MGYYLHRLKDERTRYRGNEIRGGNHSFLRSKVFAAPEVAPDRLTYRLEPDQIAPAEYPLRVAFGISYALRAGQLEITFTFENQEPETVAHVSFGLHPGFAAASLASAEVLLPAGRYVRLLAPGNFLSGETETIEHPGGSMPFEKAALPGSFLLDLGEIAPRDFVFLDPLGGRRVTVAMPETPYLTLWSDGHAFICMEPCWGLPDHHEQRPFEEKLGIEQILPGATLRRAFSIAPEIMSAGTAAAAELAPVLP
jgi:galactose mutarotase-like enzyme